MASGDRAAMSRQFCKRRDVVAVRRFAPACGLVVAQVGGRLVLLGRAAAIIEVDPDQTHRSKPFDILAILDRL